MDTEDAGHGIVVGIDGSSAAQAALAWSVEEARLRGEGLLVVHAWELPVIYDGYSAGVVPPATAEQLEAVAHETVRSAVEAVLGEDRTVSIACRVRRGHPAAVLVDASDGADLLVVGSEGHGAFAGMILGSVSLHVLHRAHCTVVVVRPGWESARR